MPVFSGKYCIKFPLGDKKNYLVTSDQVPTTDQRNYSTKVQLGEPLCLIGLKWPECGQRKGNYTAEGKPPCVPIIICCLNILGEWKGLMSSSTLCEKMWMGQIWQIYCGKSQMLRVWESNGHFMPREQYSKVASLHSLRQTWNRWLKETHTCF